MESSITDNVESAGIGDIQVTSRLYACRDAARLILGPLYRLRMTELGNALITAAAAADCDILRAAHDAGRAADAIHAMQLLAAVVELVEPSP